MLALPPEQGVPVLDMRDELTVFQGWITRTGGRDLCRYRWHDGLFPHWQLLALSCENNVHALIP